MKTLHLIRHAKSSWDFPGLSDHERPLNERGIRSCRVMGPALVEAGCSFSDVYCSSATRAQDTIGQIAAHIPDCQFEWHIDCALYTFDSHELLRWCQNRQSEQLTVIGHNPAITDLVNQLAGESIINVPTCAYIQLVCDISEWSELQSGSARVSCFIKPKQLIRAG